MSTSSLGPGSPRDPALSRAKDPSHQKTFEILLSCNEAAQTKSHYRFRWAKIKRDQSTHQRWLDKQAEKEDDFPGRAEYQLAFSKGLSKDMDDLTQKIADSDRNYLQQVERLAALIDNGSKVKQPAPAAAQTPSSNTVANADLEEIKKQLATLANENAKLRETQEKHEENFKAQTKKVTEQAEALRLLKKTHEAEINALKSDLKMAETKNLEMADQNSKQLGQFGTRLGGLASDLTSQKMELQARIADRIKDKPTAATVQDKSQATSVSQEDAEALKTECKKLAGDVNSLKSAMDHHKNIMDHYPAPEELDKIMDYWTENNIEKEFARPEKILENTKAQIKAIRDEVAQLRLTSDQTQTVFSDEQKAYISACVAQETAKVTILVNETIDQIESVLVGDMERLGEKINGLLNEVGQLKKLGVAAPDGSKPATEEKIARLEALETQVQERMQDLQQQIDALKFSVKTLDTQWSNIQSKTMAEHILAQLNPFAQKQQAIYMQLQAQVRDLNALVSQSLNSLKRPASPANGMNGPGKRPRLEGQQSRPSPSSRQSSLSHETGPSRE